MLMGLLLCAGVSAQNVFNPNDLVYTYNASAAAGSPTNAGFVVDFSLEKKQNAWLTIVSGSDGHIGYSEVLSGFSGNYHKDLGFIHLARGAYAITIRTETGLKTIILVKQ